MLCVNYVPIYEVQREKSTWRQCREDVFSFAPHLQVDTNIYEHNDFKHINGVRGKMEIV